MTKDLVTVIVPVYNAEKYLDRCVGSIVGQTYDSLEIILVDDGSGDASSRMCDDWARRDDRIRVIHKENAGAGLARNSGLEAATGDWICFCDSDDYLLPVTVEHALDQVKKYSAQAVVYGMQDEDPAGCTVGNAAPESLEPVYRADAVQKIFLPCLIENRHRGAQIRNLRLSFCTCMLSAELIRRTGWEIVSERQYLSEDSYSLIRLYRDVESVAVLPEGNYVCCANENSLSRSYREDHYRKFTGFYRDCHDLADALGYSQEVHTSVSALFLSFSIGLLKQIAASDTTASRKRAEIRRIINDSVMQQAVADVSCRKYGKARTVLFQSIRCRCTLLCGVLLSAQNNLRKSG